jgi:two-component system chemotaxis response regulator CheB
MKKRKRPSIIVIGTSLGGFKALEIVLGGLPSDFQTPIAVVQHRHKASNEILGSFLERATKLKIADAEDKQPIKGNRVYLAPANYHLLVEGNTFALSVDDPIQYSRPSIDVLFESAADACGDEVVGVVLTGANEDGARGAKRIKEAGGIVLVQDPKTAEAPEMPSAAIRCTKVDRILPLVEISQYLIKLDQAVPG